MQAFLPPAPLNTIVEGWGRVEGGLFEEGRPHREDPRVPRYY